jgi:hypothetical protein
VNDLDKIYETAPPAPRAKLTADTITDEQIREQMEDAWDVYANACRALGFSPINGTKYTDPESTREHRARCADIANAEANADKTKP